ncbi:MAG TPA: ATP-binding protein [Pyrinomonadaceae bacterium]|jgi:ATP-dependent DNA helicase RecG|nr:ATP-binding protein [Pyrinomonadaceae bacterium]
MVTTIEQLEEWMQVPREIEGLEFKAARQSFSGDKVMDYCVGIANDGGGKLILGVTDKPPRSVVGTPAVGDTQDMQKKILDKLHFEVKIEELKHTNGRRVVICHIPSRPPGTPYHNDGRYLMRSGEELRAMSPDRLRQIFEEGKPDWLSLAARHNCSATDVIRLLDTQAYYDLKGEPYPVNQGAVISRFQNEKFIEEDHNGYSISNLGAILFAKKISEFEGLSRKAPRVIVYDGPDKLNASRVFAPGTKGYAVGFGGLIDFIGAQLPVNEVMGKAFREEIKMFPDIMIRELVANALIHQDFNETGTSVTVEIYGDRVEISNPGTSMISPDRFIDAYQSRNERLADVMRRMGICEEQGKGVDKVVSFAEICQLPAPDWRSGERHTLAVLQAHKPFEEMDGNERVRATYQHCALRFLMNERMNNQSLRERFKLPNDKTELVSGIISEAIRQNRIKPENPANSSRRYAKYIPYWA